MPELADTIVFGLIVVTAVIAASAGWSRFAARQRIEQKLDKIIELLERKQ